MNQPAYPQSDLAPPPPAKARPSAWRRLTRQTRRVSQFAFRIGLWLLVVFAAYAVALAYFDDTYTISGFKVPASLLEAGYHEEVVPRRILDQLLALEQRSKSVRDFGAFAQRERSTTVDVQVAGFGVSFESLAQRLRQVTGRTQRVFAGELTRSGESLVLTLRQNGIRLDAYTTALSNTENLDQALEQVFAKAALGILSVTEPYLYAVLLDEGTPEEQAKAMVAIYDLLGDDDTSEHPWAYNFLGNRANAAGDSLEAAHYFGKALALDSSFRLGYNNLFAYYQNRSLTDSMRAAIGAASRHLAKKDHDLLELMRWNLSLVEEDSVGRRAFEEKLLQRTARSQEHEELLMRMVYSRFNDGEVQRADRLIKEVLDRYPSSFQGLTNGLIANLLLEHWEDVDPLLEKANYVELPAAFLTFSEAWLAFGRDTLENDGKRLLEALDDKEMQNFGGTIDPIVRLYLAYRLKDTAQQRTLVASIFDVELSDAPNQTDLPWLDSMMHQHVQTSRAE